MADVFNPLHAQRNRDAMLVASGAYQYGDPRAYAPRVPKPQPAVGGRRAAATNPMAAYSSYLAGGAASGAATPTAGRSAGGGGLGLGGAFQEAQDRANAANEARFQDALGRSDALHSRAMGYVDQMGNAERMAADERLAKAEGRIANDLVSRGLAASTAGIAPSMAAQRERTFASHDLADRLARTRLGADVDITNQRLGMMERKNDVGPDMNLLAQLAQSQGEFGGQSGMPIFAGSMGFSPMAGSYMGAGVGGYDSGYMGGGGSSRQGADGLTPAQRMALLVNQGKAKYQSGYSKGASSGASYYGTSMNNVPQAYGGAGNAFMTQPGLRNEYYGA